MVCHSALLESSTACRLFEEDVVRVKNIHMASGHREASYEAWSFYCVAMGAFYDWYDSVQLGAHLCKPVYICIVERGVGQ